MIIIRMSPHCSEVNGLGTQIPGIPNWDFSKSKSWLIKQNQIVKFY